VKVKKGGIMFECWNVGMFECSNVRMFEWWNGGLEGLGGLESLEFRGR
jgi:hypothetical protein